MSNVIKLSDYNKKIKEVVVPEQDGFAQLEYKNSEELDLAQRIERIKSSISRIDKLMKEIKADSK